MIHLVTGGERSGKSAYAQSLAKSLAGNPVYLATAKIWDKDFEDRVSRHRSDRDESWETIEEQTQLGSVLPTGRVVVIDCVTLWLTNYFSQYDYDKEKSLKAAKEEFDKIKDYEGTLLIITNEIGMGVHAERKTGRDFVELQGWMNQYIASHADNVTLMVSGLPLKVK